MKNKSSKNKILDNNKVASPSSLNKGMNFNQKFPYLIAFIGFLALSLLSWLLLTFIILFPLSIVSLSNRDEYEAKALLLQIGLQAVISFYAFKFVIKKNVIPYITNK